MKLQNYKLTRKIYYHLSLYIYSSRLPSPY